METLLRGIRNNEPRAIARAITIVENNEHGSESILSSLDHKSVDASLVIGITGSPGVGKSTLTNALVSSLRSLGKRVGIIAVDPSSPLSGGALLGDRIRMMSHALDPDVVVRSMATRGRLGGLCSAAGAVVRVMASAGCSPVIIETVGVGQSEMDIVRLADITMMVMAPGLGDEIQAMKAGILEVADLLVVNKMDCRGAETLTMEMESVLREKDDALRRICQTKATDGYGVDRLIETIYELESLFRQKGEFMKRRQKSREIEVIERALEMLKPQLQETFRSEINKESNDPQKAAHELIARFYKKLSAEP
ncbi:MAG: methylmalonyl Co-A mutase-associated GTPase MeaB [Desulfobulbaceae bacterium]|nr:methylmalonyl Co-A mutase-associated GTPase MeaB [Desulfobulbaceae bacterium]